MKKIFLLWLTSISFFINASENLETQTSEDSFINSVMRMAIGDTTTATADEDSLDEHFFEPIESLPEGTSFLCQVIPVSKKQENGRVYYVGLFQKNPIPEDKTFFLSSIDEIQEFSTSTSTTNISFIEWCKENSIVDFRNNTNVTYVYSYDENAKRFNCLFFKEHSNEDFEFIRTEFIQNKGSDTLEKLAEIDMLSYLFACNKPDLTKSSEISYIADDHAKAAIGTYLDWLKGVFQPTEEGNLEEDDDDETFITISDEE